MVEKHQTSFMDVPLAQCSTDSVGGETCTFLGEVLSLTRISSYIPSWSSWGPQNLSDTANLFQIWHT